MKRIKLIYSKDFPKDEDFTGIVDWYTPDNIYECTMYYLHARVHREDGPACIYQNKPPEYYLYGRLFNKEIYWILTLTYTQKGIEIPRDLIKKYRLYDY